MKKFFYYFTVFCCALFLSNSTLQAQCETWVNPTPETGWTDFNGLFGGAPCDDGTGCAFNEIDAFEVFASEAYSIDGFQAGGEYAFSMCNGAGAGSWVPEFTIIAPSGAIDAFGPGDGDGCTITWTASEEGTYLIVINDADECGGGPNVDVGNGFPALTCISGTVCATSCNAGVLTTTGEVSICSADGTFDIITENDSIPAGGGHGWAFSDVLGGTGGVAGGLTLLGTPSDATYDADLNGVLSFNNLDPLSGPWVIRSVVYTDPDDATATTCSVSADSLIVFFGTESPDVTAIDNADGSATADVDGGAEPYTYEWSDGQTTETATNLPNGDYTVTVTDANGCSGEASVSITVSSVDNVDELVSLSLTPNPTSGLLNVNMTLSSNEEVWVTIFDMTGRTVSQLKEVTNGTQMNFDLSQEPEGLYLVKIAVGDSFLSRRVMVTR